MKLAACSKTHPSARRPHFRMPRPRSTRGCTRLCGPVGAVSTGLGRQQECLSLSRWSGPLRHTFIRPMIIAYDPRNEMRSGSSVSANACLDRRCARRRECGLTGCHCTRGDGFIPEHGIAGRAQARVQWESMPWLVALTTVLVPTLGGLIVGLIHRHLSPAKRPLGPPDVVEAVQFHKPLPDLRSGLVSTVTAALSLGAGASVGQYGPMVYLGALLGGLAHRLRLGVPRHYATRAFAPVTVASVTGYVIANVIFERPALFRIEFAGVEHGYEFALVALLGLLVALAAIGFMRLLLAIGP